MKIAVGTTSELKLRAVKNALNRGGINAEVLGFKVESEVHKQPFSKEEIITGALNRARNALAVANLADYGIGIESGIVSENEKFFELAACIIVDKNGVVGESFSAAVETPAEVVRKIRAENSEAGMVTAELAGIQEKDPLFWYTNGKMKRDELLEDAIFLALSRGFLNPLAYE